MQALPDKGEPSVFRNILRGLKIAPPNNPIAQVPVPMEPNAAGDKP